MLNKTLALVQCLEERRIPKKKNSSLQSLTYKPLAGGHP